MCILLGRGQRGSRFACRVVGVGSRGFGRGMLLVGTQSYSDSEIETESVMMIEIGTFVR